MEHKSNYYPDRNMCYCVYTYIHLPNWITVVWILTLKALVQKITVRQMWVADHCVDQQQPHKISRCAIQGIHAHYFWNHTTQYIGFLP